MDVDRLFKVPKLPAGVKRKLPDNPTPEMLKKMRPDPHSQVDSDGDGHGTTAPKRQVTVEDEAEEDQDTSFAPGGDADYFVEEDEEGRFYGGGLTSQQKDILSIFEKAEGEGNQDEPEEVTLPSIRRMLARFERAVNKNQDQRSKYSDDPTKFIDSEADLDSAIKSLLPLAQSPVLAYPEIVRSGALAMLIGLLSHENVDIVIDAVELFHELTDEDVGNESEDDVEETQAALKVLIEALVDLSILELLVDNLSRLNEAEESDRQGVFHIIGVFENILGFNPDLSEKLVSQTKIMNWLLERILQKTHDENRCYAAELLPILLQNSSANREELGKKDGVETVLKALSQFRRRDPVDADEAEFMENLFDALCSALTEPGIKSLFLASEGVDLMLLMMKEKLQSKSRSIKVLDYAMSGPAGSEVCSTFVEVLGLKTLFSAFMGKASKKQKRNPGTQATEDTSHILGIISSLFTNLPSDSSGRIRLLAKFVENEYEKVDKLLEIREHASNRLKQTDAEIETEKKDILTDGAIEPEHEDLWYLRRLDGGLFTLQTVDYILAWIAVEDDGARSHLTKMLERKNLTLENIRKMLQTYHDNVDTDDSGGKSAVGMSQKEILEHLITFLQECS
ncbi:Catenin-beta-like protein [Pisolithus marmoratus]|nr:Catenin-beta-like protein [Pisolithus marmoratus]